jgi:hypothetical protein
MTELPRPHLGDTQIAMEQNCTQTPEIETPPEIESTSTCLANMDSSFEDDATGLLVDCDESQLDISLKVNHFECA